MDTGQGGRCDGGTPAGARPDFTRTSGPHPQPRTEVRASGESKEVGSGSSPPRGHLSFTAQLAWTSTGTEGREPEEGADPSSV